MKIEIDLPIYHYKLLEHISNYVGMSMKEIVESATKTHIEEFDKAMHEYIRNEVWGDSWEDS